MSFRKKMGRKMIINSKPEKYDERDSVFGEILWNFQECISRASCKLISLWDEWSRFIQQSAVLRLAMLNAEK